MVQDQNKDPAGSSTFGEELSEVSGTIHRIVYRNEDGTFCVTRLTPKETSELHITAVGALGGLHEGEEVVLRGTWKFHSKFGKQLAVESYRLSNPSTILGLKKYLSSDLIKGIGKKYADRIVSRFGLETIAIIEKSPSRLTEVEGIGRGRATKIIDGWNSHREVMEVMVFLQGHGISPIFATKIYKHYGKNCIDAVKTDPYQLINKIRGIGFSSADRIAASLGYERDSQARISAGIIHLLEQGLVRGSLYVELESLKSQTAALLGLNQEKYENDIRESLQLLHGKKTINAITHSNANYVCLQSSLNTERQVAKQLERVGAVKTSDNTPNLHNVYQDLRTGKYSNKIVLSEAQQHGIMSALKNKITVITGGPGTGKTTLARALTSILTTHGVRFQLAGPTGKAAKRLQQSTGHFALTLHRLLEFSPEKMDFLKNSENALSLDYLVVDEASMVDIFLAKALLEAIPTYAKLLLIGDVNQLPPVGPGNFLRDVIDSATCECIRLEQIFRQSQESGIVMNAHQINHGKFPNYRTSDFKFVMEKNPENLQTRLTQIFCGGLQRLGISPSKCTVLSPMNRGNAGTAQINKLLQELLNPPLRNKNEIQTGHSVFRVGDKIMQTANNYDKNVFNGDTGIVEAVSGENKVILVKFEDRIIDYKNDDLDELALAYSLSIHKSQGSEYDAVVVPIFVQHFPVLQRNLLYTAITRAKKLCILVGDPRAIGIATGTVKQNERITMLSHFLSGEI